MKYLLLCPLALIIFVGCAKREAEPEVVVAPPLPPRVVEATPAPARKNKTIIVVQPTSKPKVVVVPPSADKNIVVKPPRTTNEKIIATPPPTTDKSIIATPPPKLSKPAPIAKPLIKPTAKPAIKPSVKPTPKPLVRPTVKPSPTKIAAAQPQPTLIVRALVVSTSNVPDPSTVAYSNSLVFSKYRVVSIEKGAYEAQEILVAQWGMKGKKLTSAARLHAGDSARLQLVPLDDMPNLERIMRNDDTADYDSTPYFALEK